LIEAVTAGNIEQVQALLDEGADVKGAMGQTALTEAAMEGHKAVIQVLLNAGAELNEKDNSGETALMWAAFGGHSDVVRVVLDAGADVNIVDEYGRTALDEGAGSIKAPEGKGYVDVVKVLLEAGADVNPSSGGSSPLASAAFRGHTDVREFCWKPVQT